jgi:5,10-methenyltetrahydromethanopterin hydrogenase
MRRRRPRIDPHAYALAVIGVLAKDFGDEIRDDVTSSVIANAIERQMRNPSDMFEVIVDDPISANWRLKADREDPKRVRLAHCPLNPERIDGKRERRINEALRAIGLEG